MDRKPYIQPVLTAVTFLVERGFAESLPVGMLGTPLENHIEMLMYMPGDGDDYHETEVFQRHETWVQGENGSFWQ